MKCVAVNVLISPVTTGFSETGGVVPVSLLFFFSTWNQKRERCGRQVCRDLYPICDEFSNSS